MEAGFSWYRRYISSTSPALGPSASTSMSAMGPVSRRCVARSDVDDIRSSGPHQLAQAEREVERLAGVEARVAERLVAAVEVGRGDLVEAAEAFGDVVARELD